MGIWIWIWQWEFGYANLMKFSGFVFVHNNLFGPFSCRLNCFFYSKFSFLALLMIIFHIWMEIIQELFLSKLQNQVAFEYDFGWFCKFGIQFVLEFEFDNFNLDMSTWWNLAILFLFTISCLDHLVAGSIASFVVSLALVLYYSFGSFVGLELIDNLFISTFSLLLNLSRP